VERFHHDPHSVPCHLLRRLRARSSRQHSVCRRLAATSRRQREFVSDLPSIVLAINDLVFRLVDAVDLTLDGFIDYGAGDWPSRYLTYLLWIASVLEPMLVLSFSVVRLIAIRRPLQVGLVAYVISRDFD